MATPFDTLTSTAPAMATDKQLSYLRSLLMDKAAIKGISDADASLQLDMWLPTLSKADASHQIGEALNWLENNRPAKTASSLEDGFYELADGRIVKVIHAVHGSGNQYGKVFNSETGKFDMASGILRTVRAEGKRIDTDPQRAAELGKLYGICMCCGLELTDETSIERGFGPVCASKRGW